MKKIITLLICIAAYLSSQAQSLNKLTDFTTLSYSVNESTVLNSKVAWAQAGATGSLFLKAINSDVWAGECRCKKPDFGCGANFVCARYCKGKCLFSVGLKNDQITQINITSSGDDYPKIVPIR